MANRFERAKRYTEKYKSILKPCKYCGSTDIHITSDRTIFNPKDVWSVGCANCGDCVYGKPTVKEAVERWNERYGE